MIATRTIAALVAAPVAVTAMLAGGTSPAQAATTEFRANSWDVAGIGASGRTLRLQYTSSRDCNGAFLGPQSRVVETDSAVTIELFDVVDLPPPGAPRLACPLLLPAPGPAYVTLSAPLAGRSIKGRIPGLATHFPSDRSAGIRVPRVVGFSIWEARRLIVRSGLKVQIRRSDRPVTRTQVVGQGPSGRLQPQETVRLHVGFAR